MFHGSIVALVTPMHSNGEVDFDSFDQLLDWHISSGTDAIVVLGTTGESATITLPERLQLVRLAAKRLKGKRPLIVGTGANSTQVTIDLTRQAMTEGADAALIVTPYYNKPTQEGLYLHYQAVADAVAIPQILYNVPGRTGCDLLPATVIRLSAVGNIVGLKDATSDIGRVATILEGANQKLDMYSGEDGTAFDFMQAGGKAVVSVTANIVPDAMQAFCHFCLAKDVEQAAALNEKLLPLHEVLFLESNPIPTKWALHAMGKIPPGIRLPLTPLSAAHQATVRSALQQFGTL